MWSGYQGVFTGYGTKMKTDCENQVEGAVIRQILSFFFKIWYYNNRFGYPGERDMELLNE